MPLFDLPLAELRSYRPERHEPADFDRFWRDTLTKAETDPLDATFTPYDAGLSLVDVWDVRFTGYGGHRVAGWFLAPRGATGPLPAVTQYLGYQGGRQFPMDWLAYPAAGYAFLVMDTRGQGTATGDPDPGVNPQVPGFLTRGLTDRDSYYYRRVFTDAVRAVDAARSHPLVDPDRLVVAGGSQGGAIAQAVAGLRPDLAAALIDVPFLTHFRRASELVGEKSGYGEIVEYLVRCRVDPEEVFTVLDYFDGVNLASRATAPARYSVALMDAVCPPSTVFAAYNSYGGSAEIDVWPYNGHEGGAQLQRIRQLRWLKEIL